MLKIPRPRKPVAADSFGKGHGIPLAVLVVMNPKAEELKRRTFKFALAIIALCRSLRETWEGRDLIRAARITTDPALQRLLGEAGELTAIFSQSQLTAKANAAEHARAQSLAPIPNPSINPSIRRSSIVNYTVQKR